MYEIKLRTIMKIKKLNIKYKSVFVYIVLYS